MYQHKCSTVMYLNQQVNASSYSTKVDTFQIQSLNMQYYYYKTSKFQVSTAKPNIATIHCLPVSQLQ